MTSRGKFEKVKVVNLDGIYSRDISEGLGESLIIDNKGSKLLHTSPVPQFSFASPHTPCSIHFGNIRPGLVASEENNSFLGLGEGLNLVSYNKGNLRDSLNLMSPM